MLLGSFCCFLTVCSTKKLFDKLQSIYKVFANDFILNVEDYHKAKAIWVKDHCSKQWKWNSFRYSRRDRLCNSNMQTSVEIKDPTTITCHIIRWSGIMCWLCFKHNIKKCDSCRQQNTRFLWWTNNITEVVMIKFGSGRYA